MVNSACLPNTHLRRNREYLDALACGFSSRIRERRLFAMLVSYADDSGTIKEGPAFILAGYVANVQQWNLFSDEWEKALDDPLRDGSHRIEYFKATEAENQTGCFIGWSKENCEKVVMLMAAVVQRHALYAVRVTIGASDFLEVQEQYPHHPQSPYELLFNHFMIAAINYKTQNMKIEDKIRFIFDEQNKEGDRAKSRFIGAINRLPQEASSQIAGEPLFEDDKQLLPLQAADLFAWQLRRYHYDCRTKGRRIDESEVRPALRMLLAVPEQSKDYMGKDIYEDFDRLKRLFPSGWA